MICGGRLVAGSFASGYKPVAGIDVVRRLATDDEVAEYCAWLESHGLGRRAEVLLDEYLRDGRILVTQH
jgi:hypothetical protein